VTGNNNSTDLPRIKYQRTITKIDGCDHIDIDVRGSTLDECRKHVDEILKESGFK
jgi:predicted molibdopterin-dependent oxidoreductase YjgC